MCADLLSCLQLLLPRFVRAVVGGGCAGHAAVQAGRAVLAAVDALAHLLGVPVVRAVDPDRRRSAPPLQHRPLERSALLLNVFPCDSHVATTQRPVAGWTSAPLPSTRARSSTAAPARRSPGSGEHAQAHCLHAHSRCVDARSGEADTQFPFVPLIPHPTAANDKWTEKGWNFYCSCTSSFVKTWHDLIRPH